MTNPVLAETGGLSHSVPISLIYFDGARVETRGVFARLEQTPASLGAVFKSMGWQAWVPTPALPEDVEYVIVAHLEHRVVNRQRTQAPLMDTTRFEVQGAAAAVEDSLVDFDPADFDPADFG